MFACKRNDNTLLEKTNLNENIVVSSGRFYSSHENTYPATLLWLAQDAFIVLMRIHTLLPYCSFSTLDNFYKFSAYLELQQKDNAYYNQSRGVYFSELHGF